MLFIRVQYMYTPSHSCRLITLVPSLHAILITCNTQIAHQSSGSLEVAQVTWSQSSLLPHFSQPSSTERRPSSAMSPITVFIETVRSDDGCIVEPIFLNIHFSGIVTLLPSRIVCFCVDFDSLQLMNIPANSSNRQTSWEVCWTTLSCHWRRKSSSKG